MREGEEVRRVGEEGGKRRCKTDGGRGGKPVNR